MPSSSPARAAGVLVLAALLVAPPAAGAARARRPAPALRLVVSGSDRVGGSWVAVRGQRLRVVGTVRDPVPGEVVAVTGFAGRRRVLQARRTVTRFGSGGRFTLGLRASRVGRLFLHAAVVPGPGRPRLSATAPPVDVISPYASVGVRGLRVWFLQQRLGQLHYRVPHSGYYDGGTARAVLAYRKVNGMPRQFSAGAAIFLRLARMRGAFHARYPGHGSHVEADLGRQVLALIDPHGHVYQVLVLSSGKPSTPTVLGSFHFYSKPPGTNAEGMVDSNYFIGGYAVHGYPDVPTYPASHGCLRIPIPDASFVFGWIRLGQRIDVYY